MKFIALDNETYLISRLRPSPKVVCTSYYNGEHSELWAGDDLLPRWRSVLLDDNITIIGKSINYDMTTIAATFPELLPLVFEKYRKGLVTDVSHRQQLWDVAQGRTYDDDKLASYSLGSLSELILGEKMAGKSKVKDDGWRLHYGELDGVPLEDWPEEAREYAITDAVTTWRIWDAQNEVQDEIVGEADMAYSDFVLRLIECYGMRTNPRAVERCRDFFMAEQQRLEPRLLASGLIRKDRKGVVVDRKAAEARVVACCEARGIEIPRTDKGGVSTDKATCLKVADPLLLDRSEYVSAGKMLSTYIPALAAGVDGPIATHFQFAATGRTTSSAPREPMVGMNFQSQPRKGGIRECFYPRPGYVYCAADFSGAELHTLAQICKLKVGFSVLGDKLTSGDDVHLYVAALLLGIPEAEAIARKNAGDESVDEARQDAKAANFGFPGGMRERTFMETQVKQREKLWKKEDATTLRETWLAAFPEMDQYFEYCTRELGPQEDATIELPFTGRLRRVDTLMKCCNTYFQGLAAEGALAALREASRQCYVVKASSLYKCRIVNFVHDEIIMEVPLWKDTTLVAMTLKKIMEDQFNRFVPDYPAHVDPVLMGYWSKKAKSKLVDGELSIWNV